MVTDKAISEMRKNGRKFIFTNKAENYFATVNVEICQSNDYTPFETKAILNILFFVRRGSLDQKSKDDVFEMLCKTTFTKKLIPILTDVIKRFEKIEAFEQLSNLQTFIAEISKDYRLKRKAFLNQLPIKKATNHKVNSS